MGLIQQDFALPGRQDVPVNFDVLSLTLDGEVTVATRLQETQEILLQFGCWLHLSRDVSSFLTSTFNWLTGNLLVLLQQIYFTSYFNWLTDLVTGFGLLLDDDDDFALAVTSEDGLEVRQSLHERTWSRCRECIAVQWSVQHSAVYAGLEIILIEIF